MKSSRAGLDKTRLSVVLPCNVAANKHVFCKNGFIKINVGNDVPVKNNSEMNT